MNTLLQQLINGVDTGSQYALWAVGYGLVYQVLGLMHFAHGDTLLLGMYIGFAFVVTLTLPLPIALALTVLVAAVLASLVERTVYAPLVRRNQNVSAFIAALGAAYILRNIDTLGWGQGVQVFPRVLPSGAISVGSFTFNTGPMIDLATALVVVALFVCFLRFTKHGQAVVALAQDRETASLMGIPVGRLITGIYALSGAIGVVGAFLYFNEFGLIQSTDGFFITLKAFVAAMIGGIGRIEGAVLGGLLLGVTEAMLIQYVSSQYTDALEFALLAIILVVRPTGFFGRREVVKL
jgi:branched-chain amino acid transport system permease protein